MFYSETFGEGNINEVISIICVGVISFCIVFLSPDANYLFIEHLLFSLPEIWNLGIQDQNGGMGVHTTVKY